MGVALGGADLGVPQQPPDHFQRRAARHQQRGEGVTQIMDANVGDFSLHAHPLPETLEVNHRLARDIAREEEGAALRHGIAAQADQGDCLVRDRHPVDAALFGVGRLLGPDCQIKVELIEGRGTGLAAAGASEHAQPDYPGGALIGIGAEGIGETLDFVEGEEPLAGRFRALAETGGRIVGTHFPCDGKAEHLAQHLADTVRSHGRRLEGLRRGL